MKNDVVREERDAMNVFSGREYLVIVVDHVNSLVGVHRVFVDVFR